MIRTFVFSTLFLIGCAANAAIISTNSYATFIASGVGAQTTNDFDSAASGTILGTQNGITFSETTGATLLISDGAGDVLSNGSVFGVTSGPNFVNMENPAGAIPNSIPLTENESITLSFSNRQAVGLFVYFDRFNIVNDGTISLSDGTATASATSATSPSEDLPINDTAYFLGLYDDTGANSISNVTLNVDNGSLRYVFDHTVTFQATAVPEPSTWLLLVGLSLGMVVRQRRKTRRHS